MFVMGGGYLPGTLPQVLGALAVLLATINVSGGFIITKRMLDMFKRKFGGYVLFIFLICPIGPSDPPEYPWLYSVPAVIFTGGFLAAASTGMAGLVQAGYLTSSILCIGMDTLAYLLDTMFMMIQVLYLVSLLRPPPGKGIFSVSSVLDLVSLLPSLLSVSR